MAKNVFDATLDVNNEIKVNTFDWSHVNNLTTQIGRVTPFIVTGKQIGRAHV